MGLTTPVLLMGFNRPNLMARVMERVREVRPQQLFIAVDGPRPDRLGEAKRVQACRDLAKGVDWPCEVNTLFQGENLGCGVGVSTAISWFFEQVEEGIILEDDVVPDPTFFGFCAELLERYRNDERVFLISGANNVPPEGITQPQAAYRFTQVPHIWGWATWRRSWAQHRLDISDWRSQMSLAHLWKASGRSVAGAAFWGSTFELLGRGEIDTWDGQLVYAAMLSGQVCAISNVCLTENIGFGDDATHTVVEVHGLPPVKSLVLPTTEAPVVIDRKADAWTRRHHYGVTMTGMITKAAKYARRKLERTT